MCAAAGATFGQVAPASFLPPTRLATPMKYTVHCTIDEVGDDDGDDSLDLGFELETDENPAIVIKNLVRQHEGVTGLCT